MQQGNEACGTCRYLKRRCWPHCEFAAYFPPDEPHKFINAHRVYGTNNIAKNLRRLNPSQRQNAANSLAYEAEARLRDPVNGAGGLVLLLEKNLREIQDEVTKAKLELSKYIGSEAFHPCLQNRLIMLPTVFDYSFSPPVEVTINPPMPEPRACPLLPTDCSSSSSATPFHLQPSAVEFPAMASSLRPFSLRALTVDFSMGRGALVIREPALAMEAEEQRQEEENEGIDYGIPEALSLSPPFVNPFELTSHGQ